MDIAIGNRNQRTGRFNFVRDENGGDVKFDDTEAHAVVTSVVEERLSYWADATHGSDLHTLKNLTRRTPSQAEAYATSSLEPLTSNEVIELNDVTAVTKNDDGIGKLLLDLDWSTPSGDSQKQRVET